MSSGAKMSGPSGSDVTMSSGMQDAGGPAAGQTPGACGAYSQGAQGGGQAGGVYG